MRIGHRLKRAYTEARLPVTICSVGVILGLLLMMTSVTAVFLFHWMPEKHFFGGFFGGMFLLVTCATVLEYYLKHTAPPQATD